MSFRHDGGRKLPLAAGKTPISCSSGLNYKEERSLRQDTQLLSKPKFCNLMALTNRTYRFSALLKIRRHVCNTLKV